MSAPVDGCVDCLLSLRMMGKWQSKRPACALHGALRDPEADAMALLERAAQAIENAGEESRRNIEWLSPRSAAAIVRLFAAAQRQGADK